MPSILDKSFKYVPSTATDVSKTFARARKELAERLRREADARESSNVADIRLRAAAAARRVG